MIKRTRVALLVVLALLSGLLLTACGPSADTPVASTPAAIATTAAMTSAAATSATTAAASSTTAATSSTTAAAASSGGNDIRIGLIGPFTGPSASFGTAIKRGATLAIEDINKAGGINGRQITLVERDDKATPNEGVTLVRDLIDKEKVLALFGTANSAVGVVEAPIVQQNKIPWLIPVTTGSKITQEPGNPSYIFRNSMVDFYQTAFVSTYVVGKYKKVAVIHDDTSYGQLGQEDLMKRFGEKNFTSNVLMNETYKAAGTPDDMKPMVNKIKEAAPDVIVNWGLGTAGGNIAKALKDSNVTIPVIGSWGLAQPELAKVGGGAENGTIVAQTFSIDSTDPKQQDFINRYKSEFKAEMDFPSGVAQAYDAMRMLGEALKQPGAADDRAKLRDALEATASFDGILKKYDKPFANQYHEALSDKDFFFVQWKDGKMYKYNG